MPKILRFVLLKGFIIFIVFLVLSETAKEDAWSCMEDNCCALDFSKLLTTLDIVLYACGKPDKDNNLEYALYMDTGEEMDYIAYHPYMEKPDDMLYCAEICKDVVVCMKTKTFEVKKEAENTATWCMEGNVDVLNKTLYEDKDICIYFHEKFIKFHGPLFNFVNSSNIW